jgi:protein disulfide-isomerase
MKKFIIAIAFALGCIATQAQELEWHTDMAKATQLSIASKKPMMLFFTGSDWCGWCMKLQKEVFKTPEFASWAKENVILVELDFPKRKEVPQQLKAQNAQLSAALKVRGYPTVWFVNADRTTQGGIKLAPAGNTGYVAGGPEAWLAIAQPFITKS